MGVVESELSRIDDWATRGRYQGVPLSGGKVAFAAANQVKRLGGAAITSTAKTLRTEPPVMLLLFRLVLDLLAPVVGGDCKDKAYPCKSKGECKDKCFSYKTWWWGKGKSEGLVGEPRGAKCLV